MVLIVLFSNTQCRDKNEKFVFRSINYDLKLGNQLHKDILLDHSVTILNPMNHPSEYALIDKIMADLLNSGFLTYRNEFNWGISILDNDEIINAFATPGGHIYVFTGLIKFVEDENMLAAVIAHEIAHADMRHATRMLQKEFGLSILAAVLLTAIDADEYSAEAVVFTVSTYLALLAYGREYENEADQLAVLYLSGTDYPCNSFIPAHSKSYRRT